MEDSLLRTECDSVLRSLSPDQIAATINISEPLVTLSFFKETPKQKDWPANSLIGCGKTSGSSI